MTDHLPATILIAAPGAELTPVLQQAGFAVVIAAEADLALSAAIRNPDLIIASAELPDMPGAELCRRLKAEPSTAAIPVLFLAPPGACEADGFLPEPVDPVALVTVVRALLRARQAETRAKLAVQRWQASFDALSQSVCLLDPEGRAVRCNRAMGGLLGLPSEALSGQPFRRAAEAALGPLELPAAVQKPGNGRRTVTELPIGERWFRATVDPVVDEQGGVAGAVLMLTDITDRKQSEEALLISEERFRIISELTADYAYAYRIQPDGQIVRQWTTGAFTSITGYTPDELDKIGWRALEHPEDAERFRARLEAMKACQSDTREWRILTKSGETRWIRDSARSMWDPATGAILVYGAARDITERRQAEARLQSVMAHGRYLLWHAFVERDPCCTQDYYWSLRVVDEAAAARFLPVGIRPGETYAEAWHRSKLRRDRTRMNLHYRRAIEAGESSYSQEFRCRSRDGEIRWLREDVSIEPLSPRNGRERWHLVGICTDITRMHAEMTARRRMEEELRDTLDTLQAVIQASPLPLMILDPDGTIRLWNPAAERLFGWGADEALGQPPRFVPAEREPEFRQILLRALQGEVLTGIELRRQRKDGLPVDVSLSTAPLRGSKGEIRGVVTLLEDITGRKHVEAGHHRLLVREHEARAEAEAAQQRLAFLAEASALLASSLDYETTLARVAPLVVPHLADWCIIDVVADDGSVRRLAAAHADPEKQSLVEELLRYPPDPNGRQPVPIVLRTGRPVLFPDLNDATLFEVSRCPDHHRIMKALAPRSAMGVPILARDRTLGVITFMAAESGRRYGPEELRLAEDLAHRVSLAVENARLYREAQEADRRKDEFLGMLAHELRNPLAGISNAIRLLGMHGPADPFVQRQRGVLERQIRQMTRLLDDLLEVSRITRGKIELRPQRLSLAGMIEQAVETSRCLLEERRHELSVSVPDEPVELEADPIRLLQILGNLLNNAARYTDPGGRIQLIAAREGDEVVLRVRDSGMGIAPELLPRVFDLFMQADRTLDRSEGGLGVGLTIAHRLAELHGGRLTAASDGPGRGSEFVLRLRIGDCGLRITGKDRPSSSSKPVFVPNPQSAIPNPQSTRLVLVVDDNRDAAESMADVLDLWGYQARLAFDGPSALEAAHACHPRVVLLDIGLPGMDGYEVARRLRQEASTRRPLLVALTGYGTTTDRLRAEEAGFDQFLTKPVELGELERLLSTAAREE